MCDENCRNGLLNKIKPYAFSLFAKKYGEDQLLDCLERNKKMVLCIIVKELVVIMIILMM